VDRGKVVWLFGWCSGVEIADITSLRPGFRPRWAKCTMNDSKKEGTGRLDQVIHERNVNSPAGGMLMKVSRS
jgi:hypothetical protein